MGDFRHTVWVMLALAAAPLVSCTSAPPPGYAASPAVLQRRGALRDSLLGLLPEAQRSLPQAREEATWVADTAYKAAASLARMYKPVFTGWYNNNLVNSTIPIRERGLCWHYQHDMYRELRRRPLRYFTLGFCVQNFKKRREHHSLYVCAATDAWPHAIILEAWRRQGRLEFIPESRFAGEDWEDEIKICKQLAVVYPEGHQYPMEHWAMVKSGKKWNTYLSTSTPEGKNSRQGKLMQENIQRAMAERHGKLTDY